MRRFADLFTRLDRSTGTGDKRAALVAYFRDAPPADAAWALWLLSGGKIGGSRALIASSGELRADRGGERDPVVAGRRQPTRWATSPKPSPLLLDDPATPAPDLPLHA